MDCPTLAEAEEWINTAKLRYFVSRLINLNPVQQKPKITSRVVNALLPLQNAKTQTMF